ncbi:hypothetical protein OHS71_13995 [Streptomyces sp. NBC_00377]|uniref:hypothetical protein n=1 Tax=unclassified Streptomyces TaxID=2593676 RepID=UPI002E1CEF22|nr:MULTISPECIES: hypothetical protein [unclassified Streptomyces]
MRIPEINALFHDPAAALVVDGRTVASAEEERFSRRKHGRRVPCRTPLGNTVGRPMVDGPRDALKCFGSAPVNLLAICPFAVRRGAMYGRG